MGQVGKIQRLIMEKNMYALRGEKIEMVPVKGKHDFAVAGFAGSYVTGGGSCTRWATALVHLREINAVLPEKDLPEQTHAIVNFTIKPDSGPAFLPTQWSEINVNFAVDAGDHVLRFAAPSDEDASAIFNALMAFVREDLVRVNIFERYVLRGILMGLVGVPLGKFVGGNEYAP